MSNVVDIFSKKDEEPEETKAEKEAADFERTMKLNKQNEERLRKERLAANRGVLRSYRIKN